MERYGSKPAKRPRSDFVIEEAGQLNYTTIFVSIVIITLICLRMCIFQINFMHFKLIGIMYSYHAITNI